MKILLTVTDTGMGGVTTAAVNFSNELIKRGHEVVFLDMSGKHQVCDRLDSSVKLGRLSGRSRYWQLGAGDLARASGIKKLFLAALGIAKKLTIRSGIWNRLIFKKYKEYGEFDVAIAYRQCAPCYFFVLNKVKAKKKLGFVHGELACMGDISSWQKYMKRFDNVCYVSHAVKDQFVEKYPELKANAAVVYNVVDEKKIKELAKEKPDVEFDSGIINFVTVSRLENGIKGSERIPEIAKLLQDKGLEFCWYIVGDGPDREKCERAVKESGLAGKVVFVGKKENPFCYLAAADVSVSVSRSESFGLSVLESLVCGTPVIAGEYPALKEISQFYNGVVSVGNSSMKIAEAITKTENKILQFPKNICLDEQMYEQFTRAVGENK